MDWRRWAMVGAVIVALAAAGCRHAPKEDPILKLSAAESLAQGKSLMGEKKYDRARPYLEHAFEVEPNSAAGRESLLLAADSLYLEGGESNFIKAEAKYRDFQNRFPTSERSAYVEYQIASCLAERMEKPDRDQTVTEKALAAFQDLERLYPNSDYSTKAEATLREVKDRLADHEYVVGHFYMRFGLSKAATNRFEYLLAHYPDYSEKDKVLYYLGLAYRRSHQPDLAQATFERLRKEFPDSTYVASLPGRAG